MAEPRLLYRPADGWVGDVIPYFWDGTLHVFYLKDDRDAHGAWSGLDWAHLTTADLLHFTELPVAVPRGSRRDLDLISGTGSVVRLPDGRFAIYYTGFNPWNRERGWPEQVVLRSLSRDLVAWQKDPSFVLVADEGRYERDVWRDPFVHQLDDGSWRMLLCARERSGPSDRRGAVAVATSDDLLHWRVQRPLLAPGTTLDLECPEVFADGDRSYLVYGTYSDRRGTRYRWSTASEGPWQMPASDALDGPDAYAMRTVSDGARRYLVGWLATRTGSRDAGQLQWGGDLIAHELIRRPDGELGVGPLDALAGAFELAPPQVTPVHGRWEVGDDRLSCRAEGLAWATLGEVGDSGMLDVVVDLDAEADEVAIVLRAAPDLESGYHLRLEPRAGRFVFDRRPHVVRMPFDEDADRTSGEARSHEIERPLRRVSGTVRVRVIVDGTAVLAYVDDVALSTRGYDLERGSWGLVVANGAARFEHVRVGRPR